MTQEIESQEQQNRRPLSMKYLFFEAVTERVKRLYKRILATTLVLLPKTSNIINFRGKPAEEVFSLIGLNTGACIYRTVPTSLSGPAIIGQCPPTIIFTNRH